MSTFTVTILEPDFRTILCPIKVLCVMMGTVPKFPQGYGISGHISYGAPSGGKTLYRGAMSPKKWVSYQTEIQILVGGGWMK